MLTCKRVLQCESTCVAGEARTRAACVTSVLCTRVVVYRAQRGERVISGGEDEAVAKPGAHIEIGKSGNREIGKPHRAHTPFYVRLSARATPLLLSVSFAE